MTTVYAIFAVIGGSVLLVQFVASAVGLGGADDLDVDVDVPDGVDGFGGADGSGDADLAEDPHGTTHLFRVISLKTVIAAFTFFGLVGLAGTSAEWEPVSTFIVAIAAGVGAMYGVYWILRSLTKLDAEGTARIQHAVGKRGTVYLRIPQERTGVGKVTVNLRDRTLEYQAVSAADALPTGAKVVVTGIVSHDTVEVAPAPNGAEE